MMNVFPTECNQKIKAYVEKKKWDFQVYKSNKRIELKINPCPFCGNTSSNFELNAVNGLFKCWACMKQGSFVSLQFELGDAKDDIMRISGQIYNKKEKPEYKTLSLEQIDGLITSLWEGSYGVLNYLKDVRHLSDDTIRHFKLGAQISPLSESLLAIPHLRNDHVALLMYRSIEEQRGGKKYIRESNMESILFNENALYESNDSVIVCEGQIDAMSVWQAGLHNVVSVSTGAGTEWPNEWVDVLSGFDKIIMVYDGDDSGRKGARNIRMRLGDDKVWIAETPEGQDMNSILASEGEQGIERVIETAKAAPIPGMESFQDGISALQDEEVGDDTSASKSYPWFLDNITNAVGEPEDGDLVEIMGAPGTGKTTLMLQQAIFLTLVKKIPMLITCMEMTVKKLTRKILQCEYMVSKDDINLEILSDALMKYQNVPLYFSCPKQDADITFLVEQATSAFRRFGVKAWTVDNLIILTEGSDNALREQAIVTRKLKDWARVYENIVYLIAHPRKIESGRVEGLGDMRGSGAVTANADMLINIHRRSLAPEKEQDLYTWNSDGNMDDMSMLDPLTSIYSPKSRDSSTKMGWLYFHGEMSHFRGALKEDFIDAKRRAEGPKKIV